MSSLRVRAERVAFPFPARSTFDSGEGPPPRPAPEMLSDTPPPATRDELLGVWRRTRTQPNGTVELALRPTAGRLVVATCAASGRHSGSAANGSEAHDDLVRPRDVFDPIHRSAVDSGMLTLALDGARLDTPLTKIGD